MNDKKPVPPSLAQFALEQLAEAGEQAAIDLTVQNVEILRAEIERRDARIAELELENAEFLKKWMRAMSSASELEQRGGVALPEFIDHVKHARKELCRLEQSPLHLRQRLAQKLTDGIARLNPCRAQSVPDGYVMVPGRMHLDANVIEAINFHCGDGQEGFGSYSDGVLWVGEIEEEDGTKTYGLHIATAEYPEEGSTTLVEFAAAQSAQQKESGDE